MLRATTQIDAALSRDFIGLFLSGFAAEMGGQAGVNWPLGLTYGACVTDDRQLDLLLPDRPYHLTHRADLINILRQGASEAGARSAPSSPSARSPSSSAPVTASSGGSFHALSCKTSAPNTSCSRAITRPSRRDQWQILRASIWPP